MFKTKEMKNDEKFYESLKRSSINSDVKSTTDNEEEKGLSCSLLAINKDDSLKPNQQQNQEYDTDIKAQQSNYVVAKVSKKVSNSSSIDNCRDNSLNIQNIIDNNIITVNPNNHNSNSSPSIIKKGDINSNQNKNVAEDDFEGVTLTSMVKNIYDENKKRKRQERREKRKLGQKNEKNKKLFANTNEQQFSKENDRRRASLIKLKQDELKKKSNKNSIAKSSSSSSVSSRINSFEVCI